jgi:hypothetical protein
VEVFYEKRLDARKTRGSVGNGEELGGSARRKSQKVPDTESRRLLTK